MFKELDTITKGRICYNLVEKALLENGWDIYVPILENTKIDCIAIKRDKMVRIQIKKTIWMQTYEAVPIRKICHNQKTYKVKFYTNQEIDFFFGVNLNTGDIYMYYQLNL